MIGTDVGGKGGIASVLRVYKESQFLNKFGIDLISSHDDRGPLRKVFCYQASMAAVIRGAVTGTLESVHVHSASRTSFLRKSILLWIARMARAVTIFHLHGAEFRKFYEQESGSLMRWWITATLSRSSRVIVLSPRWADYIRSIAPGASVDVIANPVSVAGGQAVAGEGGDNMRILFLGRADERKGVFDLIAAVASLAHRYPGVELAIGGDGDLEKVRRATEAAGVADKVRILGWIDPSRRAMELARAAVFALPSYDEGLPMAMLEAMSVGKALVVTPVGGIPDAVKDDVEGLLVPPGDTKELAKALERLLADRDLRRRVGEAARARVLCEFDTSVVVARLEGLYQGLGLSGIRETTS